MESLGVALAMLAITFWKKKKKKNYIEWFVYGGSMEFRPQQPSKSERLPRVALPSCPGPY